MSPLSLRPPLLRPGQVRHFIENLSRPRAVLDADKLKRQRAQVAFAKRLLPTLAFLLLASVALWPEIDRTADRAKMALEKLGASSTEAMHMVAPHYRGIDQRGEPYTVTAATAGEPQAGKYDLTTPEADLFMASNDANSTQRDQSWLALWSDHGIFYNHLDELDLSGEVTLYRADGMIFTTDSSAIDLHQNAVLGSAQVHGEGPLGTLDGQGFAILDHGDLLQIKGPVRLVLNAAGSRP